MAAHHSINPPTAAHAWSLTLPYWASPGAGGPAVAARTGRRWPLRLPRRGQRAGELQARSSTSADPAVEQREPLEL